MAVATNKATKSQSSTIAYILGMDSTHPSFEEVAQNKITSNNEKVVEDYRSLRMALNDFIMKKNSDGGCTYIFRHDPEEADRALRIITNNENSLMSMYLSIKNINVTEELIRRVVQRINEKAPEVIKAFEGTPANMKYIETFVNELKENEVVNIMDKYFNKPEEGKVLPYSCLSTTIAKAAKKVQFTGGALLSDSRLETFMKEIECKGGAFSSLKNVEGAEYLKTFITEAETIAFIDAESMPVVQLIALLQKIELYKVNIRVIVFSNSGSIINWDNLKLEGIKITTFERNLEKKKGLKNFNDMRILVKAAQEVSIAATAGKKINILAVSSDCDILNLEQLDGVNNIMYVAESRDKNKAMIEFLEEEGSTRQIDFIEEMMKPEEVYIMSLGIL